MTCLCAWIVCTYLVLLVVLKHLNHGNPWAMCRTASFPEVPTASRPRDRHQHVQIPDSSQPAAEQQGPRPPPPPDSPIRAENWGLDPALEGGGGSGGGGGGGGEDMVRSSPLSARAGPHDGKLPQSASSGRQRSSLSGTDSALAVAVEDRLPIRERRFLAILLQLEVLPPDAVTEKYLAHVGRAWWPFAMPRLLIGRDAGCGSRAPFLLVLVPSVASHVSLRQAIRDTWGSAAYPDFQSWPGGVNITERVKLVFVFGVTDVTEDSRQLERERQRYGDIVQHDFPDTYRNLTAKMATAFRWTREFCPLAKYILKVDEDTMVNIPVLLRLLHVICTRTARFILGHAIREAPAVRKGKWKVSKQQYPFHGYPHYLAGHSYVMTADVLHEMAARLVHPPSFFSFFSNTSTSSSSSAPPPGLLPVEDVFFTGLVASALQMRRLHSPAMASGHVRVGACQLMKGMYLSSTHFTNQSLHAAWSLARRGLCGSPAAGSLPALGAG